MNCRRALSVGNRSPVVGSWNSRKGKLPASMELAWDAGLGSAAPSSMEPGDGCLRRSSSRRWLRRLRRCSVGASLDSRLGSADASLLGSCASLRGGGDPVPSSRDWSGPTRVGGLG